MENIGCTTPFGVNIDNICIDQNKSMQALQLFKSLVDRKVMIKECPYPCKFTRSWITYGGLRPENADPNAPQFFGLNFDKFIKITKAKHSYTELELLAELGGYVGLFLGLSVLDFGQLFDMILYYVP